MALRNNKSILFWINILLLVVLIVLLVFIGLKKIPKNILNQQTSTPIDTHSPANPQNPTTVNTTTSTQPSTSLDDTGSTSQNVSDLIYTNTRYGFNLTLPRTWAGYTVVPKQGDSQSLAGYEFFLPTTDPNWVNGKTASLFVLSVYTLDEWQSIQQFDGPKPTLINQNSQYVFAYSSAQDEPDDLINRLPEVPQIVKTFKFTQ